MKREELAHTGAHKINNAVGQALLAIKLGKKRIIAETGAGQHGVATAAACALLNLECIVYMGAVDCERQKLNCFRMTEMGAKVVPVQSGSRTLKDAVNEALRDWVTNIRTTHYIIGSAVGPHPFPDIVRDLQSVIGNEARAQMLNQTSGECGHPTFTNGPGRLPDTVVACVGGGSNAIGMFSAFLGDTHPSKQAAKGHVRIVGVEAGGEHGPWLPDGTETDKHAATLTNGVVGVLHGSRTYLLQVRGRRPTSPHLPPPPPTSPHLPHPWLHAAPRLVCASPTMDAAHAARPAHSTAALSRAYAAARSAAHPPPSDSRCPPPRPGAPILERRPKMGRSRRRTRSPLASTTRGSALSTRSSNSPAASTTCTRPTPRPSTRSASSRAQRGSYRRSSRRTRCTR